MSRISKIWATRDEFWYDELKVISPYREFQYDNMIQAHLNTLFSEYFAVPYNLIIRQQGKSKGSRPDFALIRKDYVEWWIVEVETIEDRLSHVQNQVNDFTNGEYNAHLMADYVCQNYKTLYGKSLNKRNVLSLFESEVPKVLLIVDDINSTWVSALNSLNPNICILRIYRNKGKDELYHISGDYPYIFEDSSHCKFTNPSMRTLLRIFNPDVLDPIPEIINQKLDLKTRFKKWWSTKINFKDTNEGETITYLISFEGRLTQWKKIEEADNIFLQFIGHFIFQINDNYVLKRTRSNELILEKI